MTMKPKRTSFAIVYYSIFTISLFIIAPKSFGLVGTTSFTVNEGNTTNPTYYIASAPLSQDAVFTGTVASFDNSNAQLTFSTDTNASGAVTYPFYGDNIFVPSVQIPSFTVNVVGGAVTSVSPVWQPGTFKTSKTGFTDAPELLLYDADCNISAELSGHVNSGALSGKLDSVTVSNGGSGYASTPSVKVVAGPHLVKIIDNESSYKGRVFLILDNNKTRLNIDLTRIASGESSDVSTYFPVGTLVEVIPATTLGSLFGTDLTDLPANWTYGLPDATDWIYIWDILTWTYQPYFFNGTDYESNSSGGWGRGWYSKLNPSQGILNHNILYPDEAFLVTKRTSGAVTLEFDGEIETNDKQILLPESGNQKLAKNPYGADMMLAELIPSDQITTNTGSGSLFRSGTDETGDIVTFLSGTEWKRYYYDANYGNDQVTSMHIIGTRRPLDGSDNNATTMSADDFLIDDGNVTNIESCNIAGDTGQSDESYTKLTITGSSTSNLKGFTVTFSGLQGYLLYENGPQEANATSGAQVTAPDRGSIVDSVLNNTYEIVKSGTGWVVINKQRDVNFKSDEGSPSWSIGQLGTGYSREAVFYCIGGTNGVDSEGTISVGGSITVSTQGSGYTGRPQTVVSGGGWRLTTDNTDKKDNLILGASSGILIQRNSLSGTKAYIQSTNPFQ